jgi:hypothetical protein
MPEVVSKEQFIENGAKAIKMPITEFENKFNLKAEHIDWNHVGQSFNRLALERNIDVSKVHLPFSKNEYYTLAEQKLSMNQWQITEMLWNHYQPNKIWWVIVGVGLFSIISLTLYDRLIIRPRERKLQK